MSTAPSPIARLWKWLFDPRAGAAHLRALLENTPDFILEIDRQGQILYINHLPENYVGKSIREVLPPDQYQPAVEAIEAAFTSGTPQTITLQTIAPNGQTTWDSVSLGPIKQGKTVTSLTVIVPISLPRNPPKQLYVCLKPDIVGYWKIFLLLPILLK